MVGFCYWLHQIGDLFYNAYEYQDVELKNTIEIDYLEMVVKKPRQERILAKDVICLVRRVE